MAWEKIPKEHHPIFEAALPRDPRVSTIKIFGGVAAKVNGHMAAGLWADSVMVRLSPADVDKAIAPIVKNVWGGKQLPFPILFDPTFKTWETFGIDGLGTTILIDPEGKLVEGDEKTLAAKLR